MHLNQLLPERMALLGLAPASPTSQCCGLSPLTDTLSIQAALSEKMPKPPGPPRVAVSDKENANMKSKENGTQ